MAQQPPVIANREDLLEMIKVMIEEDEAVKIVITQTGNKSKYVIDETTPD